MYFALPFSHVCIKSTVQASGKLNMSYWRPAVVMSVYPGYGGLERPLPSISYSGKEWKWKHNVAMSGYCWNHLAFSASGMQAGVHAPHVYMYALNLIIILMESFIDFQQLRANLI